MKKIFKFLLMFLLVIVGVAFSVPFLFKNKIMEAVKQQINKNLLAKTNFSNVDISLFKHFPKAAISIDSISVVGINEFDGDTLIAAKNIDIAVNIMSLIQQKDMTIYAIVVNNPRLNIITLKNGNSNFNIVKPSDKTEISATESKPFSMALNSYEIVDGYLNYNDMLGNKSCQINHLQHKGTGDFTANNFILATTTTASNVNFVYGGVPYLNNVSAKINANFDIDASQKKIGFDVKEIGVNDLNLTSKGFFKVEDTGKYAMDIKFDAPATTFKSILSLVPVIYQHDFDKIKTSGSALFNGQVKGIYTATQMPSYNINLKVNDGSFTYQDLKASVNNINVLANIENPTGNTDDVVVNVETAKAIFDNEPFECRLLVKNPITSMFIDAAATGKLNLEKVTSYVKLDAGTQLKGNIDANIIAKGLVSDIEKGLYQNFTASGGATITNFLYASTKYPDAIKLNKMVATVSPQNIKLIDVAGSFKNTNFSGNGQLNNLMQYYLKGNALDGILNVNADAINLDTYMPANTAATANATSPLSVFLVPNNINFKMVANVAAIHYNKLDMQNVQGSLLVADEKVILENIVAKALDGSLGIKGFYSTKNNKKNPEISFAYDVKGVDVQKTFATFVSAQKLMPIGKFIAGKLTTQMNVNGNLGADMMPDMNSLTGGGNMLLIEGFLSKFAPLEKLASTLSIKQLEQVSLKDVKAFFEFANGKVLVKPFKLKVANIDMEVGGIHGFDQSMNYAVDIKVPKNLLGAAGNNLISGLINQANSKGLGIKQLAETINVRATVTGSIANPLVSTNLSSMAKSLTEDLKTQATAFVKNKIDSTKHAVTNAVKDTVKAIKTQVINNVKSEIEKQILGNKDSTKKGNIIENTKKGLEEKAGGLINGLFGK
jgi:AsmA-like C-terminal region